MKNTMKCEGGATRVLRRHWLVSEFIWSTRGAPKLPRQVGELHQVEDQLLPRTRGRAYVGEFDDV